MKRLFSEMQAALPMEKKGHIYRKAFTAPDQETAAVIFHSWLRESKSSRPFDNIAPWLPDLLDPLPVFQEWVEEMGGVSEFWQALAEDIIKFIWLVDSRFNHAFSWIFDRIAESNHPHDSMFQLLALAVRMERDDLVQRILPKVSMENSTPYAIAGLLKTGLRWSSKTFMEGMFSRGFSPNAIGSDGIGLIYHAFLCSTPGMVRLLIAHGADIKTRTLHGRNVCHALVTSKHHCELLRMAVLAGVDVNSKDVYGTTPLLLACEKKSNTNCIRFLLSMGADPTIDPDQSVGKVLPMAIHYQDAEAVKILIEAGADPNKKDSGNWSPLGIALALRKFEIAQLLIDSGVDTKNVSPLGDMVQTLQKNQYSPSFKEFGLKNNISPSKLHFRK